MESLADFLGVPDPRPEQSSSRERDWSSLADIAEPEQFCRAIVRTREFRQYLMNGIVLGDIPQSLMLRILDLAGWQKPPERIEHTGKDGKPIETITEVRRVVVRAERDTVYEQMEQIERGGDKKPVTH